MNFWSTQPDVVYLGDRGRCATPKHLMSTKLDRAETKKKASAEDARKLSAWAKEVKERDEWKDRYTGKRVKKTIAIHPDRAEAHHVVDRENVDTRYDTRNGLTLSFRTHELVEQNKLRIVGTVFFVLNAKRYINCVYPVRFVEVR